MEIHSPPIVPRSRPSDRLTIMVVLIMLGCCILTLVQRDRIRAWWWARELVRANTDSERNYYVTMLAALRGAAVPAATGLLRDHRPDIRSLAIAILVHGHNSQATDALMDALHDVDQDVRDDAAHALAFAYGQSATPLLGRRIFAERGDPALAMCVAIGRFEDSSATPLLIDIAVRHPDVNVRAQAAERLGYRPSPEVETVLETLTLEPIPIEAGLYDERMLSRAGEFLIANRPSSSPASMPDPPRTLAQVARRALQRLRTPPSTLPTSLPYLEPLNGSDD